MVQPFALYLVEKGVISSRQLLDAYTQMMSETPSVWEVLVQEKLLDESRLLEILTAREMAGADTISVLRQMGLWQASLEKKVLAAMNARRVPLTIQLVQSGAIKLSDLTPILDEYVVMVEESRSPSKAGGSLPQNMKESSQNAVSSNKGITPTGLDQLSPGALYGRLEEWLVDTITRKQAADAAGQIGLATVLQGKIDLLDTCGLYVDRLSRVRTLELQDLLREVDERIMALAASTATVLSDESVLVKQRAWCEALAQRETMAS